MTKIPAEILRLADEGGFKNAYHYENRDEAVALDREFWIALGKKLGWPPNKILKGVGYEENVFPWKRSAHQFYDLVLSGQDPTEWWASLVKDN